MSTVGKCLRKGTSHIPQGSGDFLEATVTEEKIWVRAGEFMRVCQSATSWLERYSRYQQEEDKERCTLSMARMDTHWGFVWNQSG